MTMETSYAVGRRPGQILEDTIWQRTAQYRLTAEAFAQARDTTAVEVMMMMTVIHVRVREIFIALYAMSQLAHLRLTK